MSEILGRTWAFLTSSGSGPKWSVPSNQPSPTAHLPHGLAQFIKAVMEAPTAQTEAELVQSHIKTVQAKMQEPNLKTSVLADCIVRAMLCAILGHPVDFAYIYALQLAQKGTITEKKIGYMGCVMFLKEDDDLILLLINTIVRDLQSTNVLENNMALITAAYLVPKEMSPMIVPILIEKTKSSKDFIRKKALICLEQVAVKNADVVQQALDSAIACLSDKDPGVVSTSIQVISALLHAYPLVEVSITEGVCAIQRQIIEGKLPREFYFHDTPAPWTQMNILKLLRCLSLETRDEIIELVVNTIEQPFPNEHSVGQAIIYEGIETLAVILPKSSNNSKVMRRIMRYLTALMKSEHGNHKYVGLCALQTLLANQEQFLLPYLTNVERDFVLNCLDNEDDSIQRKAFALLDSLATAENSKEICEKLISHVRSISDHFLKTDLINRTLQLVMKYNETSLDWRTLALLRLLQSSVDSEQKEILMKSMQEILGEKPYEAEVTEIGAKLMKLLDKPAHEENAPVTLLRLYMWTLANFAESESDSALRIMAITKRAKFEGNVVEHALKLLFDLLTASFQGRTVPKHDIRDFLDQCGKVPFDSVQDLVYEVGLVLDLSEHVADLGSCDSRDFTLSYLDHVVVRSLENGGQAYNARKLQVPVASNSSRSPSLRFTPYNIMEESDWKLSPSQPNSDGKSSTSGGTKVPEVWTLQGRVKKEDDKQAPEKLPKSNIDESVIQDLSQWN